MTETIYIKPLGKILQEASLISAPQIQVALHNLFPGAFRDSGFRGKQTNSAATSKDCLNPKHTLSIQSQHNIHNSYYTAIDDLDIPWID